MPKSGGGSLAGEIAGMEWGECLVPPSQPSPPLRTEVRRALGMEPGWLARLAPCPWLARAFGALARPRLAYAPAALMELVVLVVSQDNSCRYCYGAQRVFLAILGYDDDTIRRLERDSHVLDLGPPERAALDYGRKLSRANPRPGRAEYEELLRFGFTPAAIAEIGAVVAGTTFLNRVATLVAFPPEPFESMTERLFFRLLRPFLAWQMRPRQLGATPASAANGGPLGAIFAPLAGSPTAVGLQRAIDDAWSATALPRRTKALMWGVIGRALGCERSVGEAARTLADVGFSHADVDDVFANLGSPRLDAREARLVPFARETVRCQPAAIQKRLRELATGFEVEALLDVVGIVALANAVGRLSVLADAA